MASRTAARVLFDIGRRIAALRESRRLTQESFSELLPVSTKYLQRVEAGGANLSVKSLVRFARAFNVDVAELFVVPEPSTIGDSQPR